MLFLKKMFKNVFLKIMFKKVFLKNNNVYFFEKCLTYRFCHLFQYNLNRRVHCQTDLALLKSVNKKIK